ncbi:alpha-amylase/4-alpha-glucanotransferase domain-containing protein [Sulfurihydrogenibium sp.]|uniref:alpha-amylase/4-alpha-glucanotransferase domain-containing protein n=1 Tax=Sulfurihydrogenibium sp. TaxID=2053621 RepID=UPI0026219782|nr:alpha-amylase/4-alpha-glucanotransferase domain-containing protein [Sulfurihydrogenibium sp.]
MVKLLFGIHCHQPVDNFYEVVDDAINKSYKPFLEVVKRYPDFKFSVHYSGWLLQYIKDNDKNLFKLMQDLSYNGQIEFFSGGFYEPFLASIPSDDRRYQIEKLNNFIKENFGQIPKGLWLTERVWDSSIIPDLVETGIHYVIVDDYHFLSTGFKKEALYGYYTTESNGHKINLFPIDKNLRYLIPFKPIEKITQYLNSISKYGVNPAGIIFDDGEKFGVWPKTYWWVYEKGWLEQFLETITSSNTIQTTHYHQYINEEKPIGMAYLPITSYHEMGEWSLFAEDFEEFEELKNFLTKNGMEHYFEKFVKGNIWHNFLIKYPESNRIHKRILDLSTSSRPYKKDKNLLENLLKAQCNDVLWHGIFGGLYLPNLRNNAYRYIIKTEKELEKLSKNRKVQVKDYDFDGYEEVKVTTQNLILIFDSKESGQLTELSIKDKEFNFQNTLTRRKEGYHRNLLNPKENENTEEGISTIHNMDLKIDTNHIKDLLIYDWYTKNSFIDHITDDSFNLDNFYRCTFKEYSDFANQPFNLEYVGDQIVFKRRGGIYTDKKYNATLTKTYKVEQNKVEAVINIQTDYKEKLIYLCEFNFHFATLPQHLNKPIYHGKSNNFKIFDLYTQKTITIKTSKEMDIYSYPINTVSQSEKSLDITNQGLTVGFTTDFKEEELIKLILEVV